MSYHGPVILVDDDPDDQLILKEAIEEMGLKNELIHFDSSAKAFEFLKHSPVVPFLILCDVNMPGAGGIDFKRQIDKDSDLREKSIPFVFFSTGIDPQTVRTAYKELTVQGYFQKTASFRELKLLMEVITTYWRLCKHPNAL